MLDVRRSSNSSAETVEPHYTNGLSLPLGDGFHMMNAERRANVPFTLPTTVVTTSQYVYKGALKPFPLASSGTPLVLSHPDYRIGSLRELVTPNSIVEIRGGGAEGGGGFLKRWRQSSGNTVVRRPFIEKPLARGTHSSRGVSGASGVIGGSVQRPTVASSIAV